MFNTEENALLRDLFALLHHFVDFPIDDYTGVQYTREESYGIYCKKLARMQRTSLKHFKAKLTILALSNYGSINQRSELRIHLSQLTELELAELCTMLGLRTAYPSSARLTISREVLLEILIMAHEKRQTFEETMNDLHVLPTEVLCHKALADHHD